MCHLVTLFCNQPQASIFFDEMSRVSRDILANFLPPPGDIWWQYPVLPPPHLGGVSDIILIAPYKIDHPESLNFLLSERAFWIINNKAGFRPVSWQQQG